MEVLKQPWLTEDEISLGKPRYFHVSLSHEKSRQNLLCDRQSYSKSSLSASEEKDTTITEYLDTSRDGEVSFLLKSPGSEFDWAKYTKDLLQSCETEILFDILGDLNSHTLVLLGNDQLQQEDAQKHLKIYREYVKKKEERIKLDIEQTLKRVQLDAKSRAKTPKKTKDYAKAVKKERKTDMFVVAAKRTEKITEKSVKITEKSENIIEKSEKIIEKSEKITEKSDHERHEKMEKNEPKNPSKPEENKKEVMKVKLGFAKPKKEKDVAIKKVESNNCCPVCQKKEPNVNDHLLSTHFRLKILNDYPSSKFRCFFKDCSFVTIPASANYVRHIGLDHKILDKLIKEEAVDKDVLAPIEANIDAEKASATASKYLKKTPKVAPGQACVICQAPMKDPKPHLSSHYASKVKADFPFFRENGCYICPIVDCPKKLERSSALILHINIDHEQINTYLSEDGFEPIDKLIKKKRGRKRKLSSTANDAENVVPAAKKCNIEASLI